MSRKIEVSFPGGQTIHYSKAMAARMIARGSADYIDKWHISVRYVQPSPLKCGLERSYEKFGAEPHAVTFQGGLTRTETQPRQIQRFSGARVGHQ